MEQFTKLWENLYNTSDINSQNEIHRQLEDFMKKPALATHINALDKRIEAHELSKCITGLKNGKSYGSDLIMNDIIKAAAPVIEQPLIRLFNLCLDSGIYPEEWCKGYMVPIFKSGDRSISSCLGKLFNKLLNERLNKFLKDHNIISPVQVGFTKGHRTADHILLLKGLIDMYKNKKKHLYSCFIDFQSAFDNVWHAGLIYKLNNCGVSGKFVSLLKSMYGQLQTCVKRGTYISKYFTCNKGTRQGCVMSPNLFKIYLNDLPEILNTSECKPVIVNKKNTGCLMYADDVLLISESGKGLQNSLNKLYKYCQKWKLSINIHKTKIMVFNSRKQNISFKFGDIVLDYTNRISYLGFILTPSGKFQAMAKYLYDKANRALFMLRNKLTSLPYMSVNLYIKLFDTIILPKLLYGAEVWGAYFYKVDYNNVCINKLLLDMSNLIEKFHSKVCKQILQVNKRSNNIAVRLELGRLPLFVNITCRVLSYYVNLCKRNEHSLAESSLRLHVENKSAWFSFIKCILENLGFKTENITKNSIKGHNCRKSVFNELKNITETVYKGTILKCSKLYLYSKVKNKLRREPYLKLTNCNSRKSLSQIRISAHNLPIELGRYQNVSRPDRLCTFCKFETGDEIHCLMKCLHPTLTALRNSYLLEIFKINPQLKKLSRETLLNYILLASDFSITPLTGQYFSYIINVFRQNK